MIATREQQRDKAIELLREIGVLPLYIDCVQEDMEFVKNFWSTWNDGSGKLRELIEKFESEQGAYVYYVTHENCRFGESYGFLCVSKYLEDFPLTVVRKSKNGVVMVDGWVENITHPECSEFGTIVVKLKNDGFLVRQA